MSRLETSEAEHPCGEDICQHANLGGLQRIELWIPWFHEYHGHAEDSDSMLYENDKGQVACARSSTESDRAKPEHRHEHFCDCHFEFSPDFQSR
jgi:hypothetical protein